MSKEKRNVRATVSVLERSRAESSGPDRNERSVGMANSSKMSSFTAQENEGKQGNAPTPEHGESQSTGGRGWHGDPEGHAAAGRKGGQKVSRNREHMAQIGRKGGEAVSRDRQHMASIGRKGGQARGEKTDDNRKE